MVPLVELQNITFGYGTSPVLSDVSLRLHAGQFAAIVGPSGAGKSSLLKLLLGVLRSERGRVLVRGEVLDGRPSPHVGYVPQLETVDWNFPVTVEQVVLMGRVRRSGMWPWASREERRRVAQVLEQLEIGAYARRHIRDLSGGQQQRVFLARALVADPDLLVLDEPTSGVDMRTAENILHLLADLNRSGMTILMTTHDLNAAAAHLPWVICLRNRVIAEGEPEEVFTEDILQKTYDGEFVVICKDGMLFVQRKPHAHGWHDVAPSARGLRRAWDGAALQADGSVREAKEIEDDLVAGAIPVRVLP